MSKFYFVNGCGTEYSKPSKKINLEKHSVTKRPPNSFILYRREKQKNITISTMNLHSKDLSKEVAKMWRNEPEEVRLRYQRMAEEEKDKHFRKHPGYKYNPQQKKKQILIPDSSSQTPKLSMNNDKLLDYNITEPVSKDQWRQQDTLKEASVVEEFTFSEDLFDHIVSIPPSTLPSSVVDMSQLFPGESDLDSMSIKNYELFTILSFTQSSQPGF